MAEWNKKEEATEFRVTQKEEEKCVCLTDAMYNGQGREREGKITRERACGVYAI